MVDTAESLGLLGAALEMMIYSNAEGPCHAVSNRAFQVTQGREILEVSTNKSTSVCRKMCKSVMKYCNSTGEKARARPVEDSASPRGQDSPVVPQSRITWKSWPKRKRNNLPKYRLITATEKDRRNVTHTGIVISWTSHCQEDGSSSVVYRLFTCGGWWTEPHLGKGSPSLEWW